MSEKTRCPLQSVSSEIKRVATKFPNYHRRNKNSLKFCATAVQILVNFVIQSSIPIPEGKLKIIVEAYGF